MTEQSLIHSDALNITRFYVLHLFVHLVLYCVIAVSVCTVTNIIFKCNMLI